jgi:hypothetical protein
MPRKAMSARKPLKSGAYSACRNVGGDWRGRVVKMSLMGVSILAMLAMSNVVLT